MIRSLKASVPWWGKILAKIFLSRLPFGYGFWQGLGLFRHGHMDSILYAPRVFVSHARKAGLAGDLSGRVVLEIGPGDSVATAIVAYAYGARALLVDAGRFAKTGLSGYRALCVALSKQRLAPPDLSGARTLVDVLSACGATYLTSGLESLQQIDTASVDHIFSQAVLEHVRRREFAATMRECRRILKPSGVCSHRVDLKDHLGGGLNSLRFSERVWESSLFSESGFYTNRIQYGDMLAMFNAAGFDIIATEVDRWDRLPISRLKLASEFREIPDEELRVSGFHVLLRPATEIRPVHDGPSLPSKKLMGSVSS
jgi:SAM-dependent methyltransferase